MALAKNERSEKGKRRDKKKKERHTLRKKRSEMKKKKDNRPNLVLDLDNTLISSVPLKKLKRISKVRQRIIETLRYNDAVGYYRIFHRPYLQEFLDYICSHFHVIVWTAASDEYAKYVVNKILKVRRDYDSDYSMKHIPKREIERTLTHKNCVDAQLHCNTKTMKDLRFLPTLSDQFSDCNTIIIDDMPNVKKVNKKNAIRAQYFDVEKPNSEADTFLIQVMNKLKTMLRQYKKTGCVYVGENRKKK
jgi:TFIIF-interacting CTD phosphatase-like protein